jgi:hypothetical protein
MKIRTLLFTGLALFAFVTAPSVSAGEKSVVSGRAMDAAVVSGSQLEDNDRAAVAGVLQKDAVRDQAERMGLDPSRLEAMVATLSGSELTQVAQAAANVDAALAGGDSIVIGYTALIIILLVLIIILVA